MTRRSGATRGTGGGSWARSEPETAGILLAHIDELGQALNQHYRPAQPRFSDDSDQ